MPPITCAKCRGFPASEGDSWCVGCTAWEALGRELTGHWDNVGARRLGNDVVVSATRQLRALRSLSAGLAREGTGSGGAGSTRARSPDHPPAVPEPKDPHAIEHEQNEKSSLGEERRKAEALPKKRPSLRTTRTRVVRRRTESSVAHLGTLTIVQLKAIGRLRHHHLLRRIILVQGVCQ